MGIVFCTRSSQGERENCLSRKGEEGARRPQILWILPLESRFKVGNQAAKGRSDGKQKRRTDGRFIPSPFSVANATDGNLGGPKIRTR